LFRSEKRSLLRFLLLYLSTTFILFSLASWLFYISGKHQILDRQSESLKYEAEHLQSQLRALHHSNAPRLVYPSDQHIKSAIYDLDKHYIFGSFEKAPSLDKLNDKTKLYMVEHVEPYFLGAAYLLVSKEIDHAPIAALQRDILIFMCIAGIIFIISGYYLGKLFVAPMRDSLKQMNRFIQDTTHELNTPISSLTMATDQALKQGECTEKTLRNVSISTKQLYDIYRSLTYLNFKKKEEVSEVLQLDEILKKSVVYYKPLADIKRITFETDIEETTCVVPESQITLLFGNLIGNAIKYSSPRSKITVSLKDRILTIKDEGIGIDPEKQKEIFEKFKRGTDYSGGFGVGLNIVKSICDEYGIKIELDSELGVGTEFRLYLSL